MVNDFVQELLTVSLTTSAVIAMLLIFTPLLRKRYAAKWRYFAWLIVAVRLLIPLSPSLPVAPVNIPVPEHVVAEIAPGTDLPQGVFADPVSQVDGSIPDIIPNIPEKHAALSPADITLLVWVMGMMVFFLIQTAVYLRFRRRLRYSPRTETPAFFLDTCLEVGMDMGVDQVPDIRVCGGVPAPILTGLLRTRLYLPHGRYTRRELALILRHELVHYKRRDLWYKLALTVANGMHWFNPLVYLMTAQAGKDVELSCDDRVMVGLGNAERASYGEAILNALPIKSKWRLEPVFTTSFGSTKASMKQRLKNLFDNTAKKRGIAALCAVVLLVGMVGGVIVFTPMAAAAESTHESREASLIRNFQLYEAFGVRYDAELDAVFYNDRRVKIFLVYHPSGQTNAFELCWGDQKTSSTLYLQAVRDDAGKITGVKQLSKDDPTIRELLTIYSESQAASPSSTGDARHYVLNGNNIIEKYGIRASDKTIGQVPAEVSRWIAGCTDTGLYLRQNETDSGWDTYLYYNGGGRYPWTMTADENTVTVNLNGSSNMVTGEGYHFMQFTAPKKYENIHVLLDGVLLNMQKAGDETTALSRAVSGNAAMKTATIGDDIWYLVETEAQLRSISASDETLSRRYMQNADIAVTSVWTPIGNEEHPFTGIYNGNGFAIHGLRYKENERLRGLFGYADYADLQNISIVGIGTGPVVAINLDGELVDSAVISEETYRANVAARTSAAQTVSFVNVELRHYNSGSPYIHDIIANNTSKRMVANEICMLAFDKDGKPLKLRWNYLSSSTTPQYSFLYDWGDEEIAPGTNTDTEENTGGWSLFGFSGDTPAEVERVAYVLYNFKQITFADGTVWENPGYDAWLKTYEGKTVEVETLKGYYPFSVAVESV